MSSTAITSSIAALCVLILAGACSPEPTTQTAAPSPALSASVDAPLAPDVPIPGGIAQLVPYGREPWPGIITAGQPSKDDFESLREAGIRTVINLRNPSERGTRDEPAWMQELGLDYISIPVDGAAGLSEELARELDRCLQSADGPFLVHCGSSNRVGAAFALRAFYLQGENAETALQIGRAAGMTRLESVVRDLLN